MGLDLSFTGGGERLDIRFSNTDWDLLALLGNSCPDALETLTGVADFGESRIEERAALLAAVDAVLSSLEREKDTLPFIYGHTFVEGPSAGVSGCGMTSGIRMNGDSYFYSLKAGLGKHFLEKLGLGPDGKVHILERTDVRHLDSLQTDNCGTVRMWRKKKNTHIVRLLQELKQFLLRVDADKVTKTLG